MNEITFKHSGQLGDIIYSLFTVESLCGNSKKAIFYINLYEVIHAKWFEKSQFVYGVDKDSYNFIAPLIAAQPYIKKVLAYEDEKVDFDFDGFQTNWQFTNCEISQSIDYSKVGKWLDLPKISGVPKFNIFNRTRRYRNDVLNYSEVAKKFYFIGLRSEVDFDIPRIPVQNALQVANLLNNCNCFLGNQSLAYAIAWGLDVKTRALEVVPVKNVNDNNGFKIYDNEDLFSFCSKIEIVNDDLNKCNFLYGDNLEPVDTEKFKKRFDEVFYLNSNPDVAQAVLSGELKSGEEHYLQYGEEENRKVRNII